MKKRRALAIFFLSHKNSHIKIDKKELHTKNKIRTIKNDALNASVRQEPLSNIDCCCGVHGRPNFAFFFLSFFPPPPSSSSFFFFFFFFFSFFFFGSYSVHLRTRSHALLAVPTRPLLVSHVTPEQGGPREMVRFSVCPFFIYFFPAAPLARRTFSCHLPPAPAPPWSCRWCPTCSATAPTLPSCSCCWTMSLIPATGSFFLFVFFFFFCFLFFFL